MPCTQKRIVMDKWHWVLGKQHYMAIYLPINLGLFIHMQESLCHVQVKRIILTKGVNQDLVDFCWLAQDLDQCPTQLYGLVLL